jgi:glutathione peroxidase
MVRSLDPVALVAVCALGLSAAGCKGEASPARAAPAVSSVAATEPGPSAAGRSIHAIEQKRLDGSPASLSAWSGKVLLVVNTASECGYTPQYEGLQALHAKYEARGFSVLGFPSNDFGGQEPGTSAEIATFCKTRFGVAFPMFEKVVTKGRDRAPLYALLGDALGPPKWNFHKYLVDKKGAPVKAWPSAVAPDAREIAEAIESLLAAP